MELLQIALLGGVLALDGTSMGQFMVSRPLVAGVLTGWVVGDPTAGLMVGALLEIYLLVNFPSGGARFPEGSTGTVVAVATAAAVPGTPGAVPLALAVGLAWGHVGGLTVYWQRRANGRFVPKPDDARLGAVVGAHVTAMLVDFVRGVGVTFVGAASGQWAATRLAGSWPLGFADSAGILLAGAAISAGILLRDLGGFRKRKILFAAGIALGLVGARFL